MDYQQISKFIPPIIIEKFAPRRHINLSGDRDVEWSWVLANLPNQTQGNALDFGCGDSYIGLALAQRGFDVLAIDLQDVKWRYYHHNLRFREKDVLELGYDNHFDLVINCSTVEHVGLKGRYGISEDIEYGDLSAMRNLRHMMKRDAIMILTIPVGQDIVYHPLHRIYGEKRLPSLLLGFSVVREIFWKKDGNNIWRMVSRGEATSYKTNAGSWNPLRNTYAIGCFVLRR